MEENSPGDAAKHCMNDGADCLGRQACAAVFSRVTEQAYLAVFLAHHVWQRLDHLIVLLVMTHCREVQLVVGLPCTQWTQQMLAQHMMTHVDIAAQLACS